MDWYFEMAADFVNLILFIVKAVLGFTLAAIAWCIFTPIILMHLLWTVLTE